MREENFSTQESAENSELLKKGKRGLVHIIFGRTTVIILLLALQFFAIFGLFFYFENHIAVAYGGLTAVSLVAAIFVANSHDNPAIKLSWTVLIMLAPVFGTLLYAFVHTELGHRVMHKRLAKVLEQTSKYISKDALTMSEIKATNKELYNTASYAQKVSGYPIYPAEEIKYFDSGESMWKEMLDRLEKAERFIFIEFFIIERGIMWDKMLDIIKRKVKEGVEVRVMYDGTCAVNLLPYSYPKELAKMGIKCRMFSPLRPFVSTHYNNRDHRKILVIDGKYAFTGGANLADEYINRKARFGHWKDCAVMLSGECVKSFTLMFLQIWNIAGGKDDYEHYLSFSKRENVSDGYVLPYSDSPLDHEKLGENIYMEIINTAKDYVYIMTPYLIIDNEMSTALQNAAKRGVDVRIILPSIPDHKYAFALAKTHYKELIPAGVKIYEYTPGFVHSKLFLSDNCKAVAGTINLDYRSLYLHFECAVYMYGTSVTAEILKDFESTFPKCKAVCTADIKKQGIFTRLWGGLLKLLAPLM